MICFCGHINVISYNLHCRFHWYADRLDLKENIKSKFLRTVMAYFLVWYRQVVKFCKNQMPPTSG